MILIKKISLKECVELVNHMAELVNSWEQPIDTGEIPPSSTKFDAIVVGGGPVSYTHLTLPTNTPV